MKLIIDIDEEQYEFIKQGMPISKVIQYPALMEAICEHIENGIPLNDVKAEIQKEENIWYHDCDPDWKKFDVIRVDTVLDILDHIGQESED